MGCIGNPGRSNPQKASTLKLKLPAHRAGLPGHASGEQNVSKGSLLHIVPLEPAYKAGLAEHLPAKDKDSTLVPTVCLTR